MNESNKKYNSNKYGKHLLSLTFEDQIHTILFSSSHMLFTQNLFCLEFNRRFKKGKIFPIIK